MASRDTQTTILDAAERQFARHGYGATSLRKIIGEAGVNLAAVHYHFGSKESLLTAVLARRFQPLNELRLRLLSEIESAHPHGLLPLEAVLEVLIGPAIRMSGDAGLGGEVFMALAGRLFSEPNERVQEVFNSQFREVAQRFHGALQRALPKLPPTELHWRIHFLIGTLAHTMCGGERLAFFSRGQCDPGDKDAVIRRLVAYNSTGLRAPVVAAGKPAGKGRRK